MGMFVHITTTRSARKILRAGIRGPVYCMPVMPNFMITHQWIRELRRQGEMHPRAVGIYFRIPTTETVYCGHYIGRAEAMPAGRAANMVMRAEVPLGYEVILDRSVAAGDIHAVRNLPAVGWRYHPGAHFRPAKCACRYCLPKGGVKTRRLRNRLDPTGTRY